jgi:hypothetical protein
MFARLDRRRFAAGSGSDSTDPGRRHSRQDTPEQIIVESPFLPTEPESLAESGLTDGMVEGLILKHLAHVATATGREIAGQIRLPFGIVGDVLRRLKDDRLIVYKGASTVGDFLYEPTEAGYERARLLSEQCTYFGAAPVPLEQYARSVSAQSIRRYPPPRLTRSAARSPIWSLARSCSCNSARRSVPGWGSSSTVRRAMARQQFPVSQKNRKNGGYCWRVFVKGRGEQTFPSSASIGYINGAWDQG